MTKVHFLCSKNDRYNTAPAARFGELTFHDSLPSPFNTDDFLDAVGKLDIQEGDYIALTGPMLSVALGFAGVVMQFEFALNFLLFDARNNEYVSRSIAE